MNTGEAGAETEMLVSLEKGWREEGERLERSWKVGKGEGSWGDAGLLRVGVGVAGEMGRAWLGGQDTGLSLCFSFSPMAPLL